MPKANTKKAKVKKPKAKKPNKKAAKGKKKAVKKSQIKPLPKNSNQAGASAPLHSTSKIPIAHNQTLQIERKDQNDAKALEKINEDINTGRKVVSNLVAQQQKQPEVIKIVEPKTKVTAKKKHPPESANMIATSKYNDPDKKKKVRERLQKHVPIKLEEDDDIPIVQKTPHKPIYRTPVKTRQYTSNAIKKRNYIENYFQTYDANNARDRFVFEALIHKFPILSSADYDVSDALAVSSNEDVDDIVLYIKQLEEDYKQLHAKVPNPIPDPEDYGVNPTDLDDSSDPTTNVDNNLPALQDPTQQTNNTGLNMGGSSSNIFGSNSNDYMFDD